MPTELKCNFRLLRLTSEHLARLRELGDGAPMRERQAEDETWVAVIPLQPDRSYQWIGKFLEEHDLGERAHGFFLSVVSETDSEIVRVPDYVVDLIRELDGVVVDFSFTYIELDDE